MTTTLVIQSYCYSWLILLKAINLMLKVNWHISSIALWDTELRWHRFVSSAMELMCQLSFNITLIALRGISHVITVVLSFSVLLYVFSSLSWLLSLSLSLSETSLSLSGTVKYSVSWHLAYILQLPQDTAALNHTKKKWLLITWHLFPLSPFSFPLMVPLCTSSPRMNLCNIVSVLTSHLLPPDIAGGINTWTAASGWCTHSHGNIRNG